jgi:aspartyl aminopeptidase
MDNLKDTLRFRRRNASEQLSATETARADAFSGQYIDFLNTAKTERETIAAAIGLVQARGFVPWREGLPAGAGARFFRVYHGRALVVFAGGQAPLAEGLSIAVAHADSPRLDLKMCPLREEAGMAYFDTHYYGMVKPYQWAGIPLALHGLIIRTDGARIPVRIGEEPGDPVFFIADLLPHLSSRQMRRPGAEVIRAEDLNILAGLRLYPGEQGAGAVKLNILRLLHEKYGVTEADLVSADLQAVPAFPARDLGLDRSMVGGYGQDDKACAFPALTALLDLARVPAYAACVVLADKEETGSLGLGGMRSPFFTNFVTDLLDAESARLNAGVPVAVHRVLERSFCISADVICAYDPAYASVFDAEGEAILNGGVALFRYWGSGGKEHSNDAPAEVAAYLRRILDQAGVLWQSGAGGKVDAGESGTLSRFFANLGIPTIDLGVPVLSMHAPFEAVAKTDVYMAYRALAAFFAREEPFTVLR